MKNKKIIYILLILIIITIFIFKYQNIKQNEEKYKIKIPSNKEIDNYVKVAIQKEKEKIIFEKNIDGNIIEMNNLGEVFVIKDGKKKKIDDLGGNKIYNDVRIVDIFKYTTKENKIYYIEVLKYDDEYDFTILSNNFENLIDLR